MGAVYEARQEPLERRVALKTLHPDAARNRDALARFYNEAKVLSRLEHPSIVQVSDFGSTPDGEAYLVMEFLRGESLEKRLDRLGTRGERLPIAIVLQLAFQVADVLAIAHAQDVIHRDIKPANLMLVADPVAPGGERVKVLDFGLAKLTNGQESGGVKTDTQAVMGTPAYMSPEQCAGAGGVDARTDVYSLGCVLYEMIAARPPFVAEGAGQLIGMHLFQAHPKLLSVAPTVPVDLAELVERMLAKDKSLRPSMSVAADELGRLVSRLSIGSPIARSRLPTSTDPDATRAVVRAGANSTLGQHTGQRPSPLGAKTRSLVLAGLCLVFLICGSVLWLSFKDESHGSKTPENIAELHGGDTAQPKSVHWKVTSEPAQAILSDSTGMEVGRTPWIKDERASAGLLRLQVHLDGFESADLTLDRAQSVAKHIVMTPTRQVQQPPPIRPQPKKPLTKTLPGKVENPRKSKFGYEE